MTIIQIFTIRTEKNTIVFFMILLGKTLSIISGFIIPKMEPYISGMVQPEQAD